MPLTGEAPAPQKRPRIVTNPAPLGQCGILTIRRYTMPELAIGLLRHVLQIAGGVLMARGIIDPTGWDLVAGTATSAATAGWYLYSRRR